MKTLVRLGSLGAVAVLLAWSGCATVKVTVCGQCGEHLSAHAGTATDVQEPPMDTTSIRWKAHGSDDWYPTITATVMGLNAPNVVDGTLLTHAWVVYGGISTQQDICDDTWYLDEDNRMTDGSVEEPPKTEWVRKIPMEDKPVAPGSYLSVDVVMKPNRGGSSEGETRILHLCGRAPSDPPSSL